jgi:CTP:molybdopterin cytidylyltransferase MocA
MSNSKGATNRPAVLVLAASRSGADDPVARLKGTTHKCLAPIDGVVMLERVVQAILDSEVLGQIYISIESEALLRSVPALEKWLDAGVIRMAPVKGNLADSVLAAAEVMEPAFPMVITTGDNALHTAEILQDFVGQFNALQGDAAAGFTTAETVIAEFPEVGLAYHRLKDGGYSSCNLYVFRSAKALTAVRIFEGGGQFGKRPMRIVKAFGIMPFIQYKFRLSTLDQLMDGIAKRLGITADIIMLPYAYGPIDVDNISFFEISEKALKARRLGNS